MNQIQANYASDGSDSDEVVSQSRKRKAYSTDWKLEVVKFANEVSVHAASKKYKIDRQNVRQWKNNGIIHCWKGKRGSLEVVDSSVSKNWTMSLPNGSENSAKRSLKSVAKSSNAKPRKCSTQRKRN
uniref:Brinker DNA-binding domain-containing protein n=1 Tax=Ditylenchus dipsaci TaxID=166011 RepID=A0A915DNI9_9BILA